MSQRQWMLPAATGLAGLAAGILIAGLVGAGAPPVPVPAVASERAGAGLTTDDVRRVVREELVARDSDSPPAPLPRDERAATVAEAAPTESQTGAVRQAESILAAAVSRRTWTETDADALREVFHDMSAEQQSETLRQFAVAVNQGRLSPQIVRIPF